jgi:hypothetical protein
LKIGSGNNISILYEPWMCNGESIGGRIKGAHFVYHTSINHLMDPYAKRRNEHVVRWVFNDNIAVKILNTPLFDQVQQDRLIWRAENHDYYSVRSAYRFCVNKLVD